MKNILIISTGGTFNKRYNPLKGELTIDATSKALYDITSKWLSIFEIVNIIAKDSLDIDDEDRQLLLSTIRRSAYTKIIIVHGTDTMDITASFLSDANLEKCIVLTGAMVPYQVNPVEATANLASAFGWLVSCDQNGVYIAMNACIGRYDSVKKDRVEGKFVKTSEK